MGTLNVVFMGTPAIVAPVLDAVARGAGALGGAVVAAYAAADRPAGRGRGSRRSPVSVYAEGLGIDVYTPERVTSAAETDRFAALEADLVVLAAYGLLLPPAFLDGPRLGALNIHPSLLPRHRGAAPVPAAILAGDTVTGVSIIRMDEGLDTGPLLAQRRVDLVGDERTPSLSERLFAIGAGLLEELLPRYVSGDLVPTPQPAEGVSVVKRFVKADGALDWSKPAVALEREVRAFDPWPGSATTWNGRRLVLIDVALIDAVVTDAAVTASVGTVVATGGGASVITGDGLLELRTVQLEGRRATPAPEFVRGHPEFVSARLPS